MSVEKTKKLPAAPQVSSVIGPSFILLGLALGSGELVMWPYLSANYGLGLLWGALLGISLQFLLNLEIMRYSLIWGESVFVGFKRLWSFWPIWFIISTFIPWGIPGFSSAAGQIICRLFNWHNQILVSIAILIFTGFVLTAGKTLYKTMEFLQRSVIIIGLPLILFFVVRLSSTSHWQEAALGLIGKGDGWWFFPSMISLTAFLGAFAYSGAGGNLNLAQSYYIKEKGLGMGKYGTKITSIINGKTKGVNLEGITFVDNKENRRKFLSWWKLLNLEHFLVFWFLGLATIILLAVLSRVTVFGQGLTSGLSFLYQQGIVIGQRTTPLFGTIFLIMAALMLYSTQLGVLESSSRIISENILLLGWQEGRKVPASLFFYLSLWGQIVLGILILLLGVTEPRSLLTLSAILNALAMMVAFPLIWRLNKKRLGKYYQPSLVRRSGLTLGFVFFLAFSLMTLARL